MPRVTRDGVSIHYEREDGDEPIVFVQGLGAGRWQWRWQREALADEYGVIAPDSRGTGRSEAGLPPLLPRLPGRIRTPILRRVAGYSVAALAADLDAVLEDAGVRNAHVVGADLGGMIAQRYAIDYRRAKTLTLCATSHGGPDAVAIAEAHQQRFASPSGASERERIRHRMRPEFSERFTNRNPHLMDRLIEWRREQDADEPALHAQDVAFGAFDASDELDQIRVPTLVCHGSDDRIVPVANGRLLAEKIPNARLREIAGGSHRVPVEAADDLTAALRSFLADSAGS